MGASQQSNAFIVHSKDDLSALIALQARQAGALNQLRTTAGWCRACFGSCLAAHCSSDSAWIPEPAGIAAAGGRTAGRTAAAGRFAADTRARAAVGAPGLCSCRRPGAPGKHGHG